jgi:hypothetical protein
MSNKKSNVQPTNQSGNAAKPRVVGSALRNPWNWGKRKPIIDDCGNKWCACIAPRLISGDGRGLAFCLLCFNPWYH